LTGHRVIARRPSTFLLIPVGSHRQGFAFGPPDRWNGSECEEK
jgi:hypothetical protein